MSLLLRMLFSAIVAWLVGFVAYYIGVRPVGIAGIIGGVAGLLLAIVTKPSPKE